MRLWQVFSFWDLRQFYGKITGIYQDGTVAIYIWGHGIYRYRASTLAR